MSKVRLGPFSKIQVSLLQQKLEKEDIPSESFEDPDLLRDFTKNIRHQRPSIYPTYSGAAEYIFLEVEREHLLLIKQDLDEMGFPLVKAEAPPEGEDYFCPRCKYSSHAPGLCPTHQLPLLDFSGWVENKNEVRDRKGRWLLRAAGLIFLFILGACLRSWLGTPEDLFRKF